MLILCIFCSPEKSLVFEIRGPLFYIINIMTSNCHVQLPGKRVRTGEHTNLPLNTVLLTYSLQQKYLMSKAAAYTTYTVFLSLKCILIFTTRNLLLNGSILFHRQSFHQQYISPTNNYQERIILK